MHIYDYIFWVNEWVYYFLSSLDENFSKPFVEACHMPTAVDHSSKAGFHIFQ